MAAAVLLEPAVDRRPSLRMTSSVPDLHYDQVRRLHGKRQEERSPSHGKRQEERRDASSSPCSILRSGMANGGSSKGTLRPDPVGALPPIETNGMAKGALRHVRSVLMDLGGSSVVSQKSLSSTGVPNSLPPSRPSSAPSVSSASVDIVSAEAYGRAEIGSKPWAYCVFQHADGADETSAGYLLPVEFAMLCGNLAYHLGEHIVRDFKFNFHTCDFNLDGRVSMEDWMRYSKILEEKFTKSRCKRAAMRYIGSRRAEHRTRVHITDGRCTDGPTSLNMFSGFDGPASLKLIRACVKHRDADLYESVEHALSKKADPNCGLAHPDFNGYTPLIFLAMAKARRDPAKRQKDISRIIKSIDLLVSAKADVHRQCDQMPFGTWVPLRFAAQMQARAGVQALLQHVEVGDRFSWAAGENVEHIMLEELGKICTPSTVLRIARMTEYDNYATVQLQLFSSSIVGGNLTASGAKRLLEGTHSRDADSLLEPGVRADPNGAGLEGVTALMNVIMKGDVQTTKELLLGRASALQVDSSGATPLHLAAAQLNPQIVDLLLEARAEPHALDFAGFSPWMLVGEALTTVGNEEKTQMHEIMEKMQPEMSAEKIIEMAEKNLDGFIDEEHASLEEMWKRFRLQESLFFNNKIVRRGAHDGREHRKELLNKLAVIIMDLLRRDPLKGNKKVLAKYLLQATRGPLCNADCIHVRYPWKVEDNRLAYRDKMREVVQEMLARFAAQCNNLRALIDDAAAREPGGVCDALRALPSDIVTVPQSWQDDDPYWRMIQKEQVLRYDPAWARGVHDGATCCLALLRLSHATQRPYTFKGEMGIVCDEGGFVRKVIDDKPAHKQGIAEGDRIVRVSYAIKHNINGPLDLKVGYEPYSKEAKARAESSGSYYVVIVRLAGTDVEPVKDLSDYSRLLQVHHASGSELLARGYIKFSQLCNEAFQVRMKEVAQRVAAREGLDIRPPKEIVGAKRLARLMEKTREAEDERQGMEWPGLEPSYLRFSYCFHILDTVRLSFTCCGFQKERECSTLDSSELSEEMEDPAVHWTVNHFPPELEDKDGSCPHPFLGTKNDDFSLGYIGPDRRGKTHEHMGDDTFYFILDLGKSYLVDKLEIVNAYQDKDLYNVRDYEIGVSDDIADFEMRAGVFPKISTTEKQSTFNINRTGRYVRMNMKKYGASSVGIAYLNVLKAVVNEEIEERKRANMSNQVLSCMKLLNEFKSLTLEKDGICLLRQKSGFAEGLTGKGGYADVKLLCLADLGSFKAFDGTEVPLRIVGEVQLILQSYMEVKNRMHLVYEADRGSFGPI